MFETYFQLQRRPFSSIPSPDQYFPASSIEEARQAVVGIVERQQGPALVVGGVGLGKSLLCQVVAESFRHRCRTVIFPSGRLCTRRALLQVILFELGLPYRDQEESELRLGLIDHVTNPDLCPNGLLLLVDEADSLTMALLDELRSLTNLTSAGNAAVRVVLFGGPRLEERFAHPRLESFNQRLAGRFYLEPFTADETAGYIQQQFSESGGEPDEVFTDGAYRSIHNASEGIPRLVNQLVDHALVMATANGRTEIGQTDVDEAWADLQQLPFPTQRRSDTSHSELPSDIIEFGQLANDDEEPNEVFAEAESSAESTLDAISDQMELIDSVGDDSEFDDSQLNARSAWPAVETEPEVSLYFHEAHDPFGDNFEDEEVVVDHFVSPDAISQRHRRQVAAEESSEIAEQLGSQFPDLHCEQDESDAPQAWNVVGGVEDRSIDGQEPESSNDNVPSHDRPPSDEAEPSTRLHAVLGANQIAQIDDELQSDAEPAGVEAVPPSDVPIRDVSAVAWPKPDVDELANQGLHFEEFDLFPTLADQPPEVDDVSFGPGVPEHAAGETDVDAAVPEEDVADVATADEPREPHEVREYEVAESVASEDTRKPDDELTGTDRIVEFSVAADEATDATAATAGLHDRHLAEDLAVEPVEQTASQTSLSFRDALKPMPAATEIASAKVSHADSDGNQDAELELHCSQQSDRDSAGECEIGELADLLAAAAERDSAPEIIEAESIPTKQATASKRGSDYRRLFSQIRSKRR